jgi:alpha-N-arabinofuranosidase
VVTGAPAPLDVAAALSADRSALVVAVVNPGSEKRSVAFEVKGAQLAGPARRFVLTGPDRFAHNAPGRPRGVTLTDTTLEAAKAELEAPPLSVVLQRFTLR